MNNKLNTLLASSLLLGASATAQAAYVDAYFSPSTINAGQSTTLVWNSSGVLYCEVPGVPGGFGKSGSVSMTPSQTTTVTVQCEYQNGSATGMVYDSATVTVNNALPKPTVSFSADPVKEWSDTTYVTWSSTNADYCFMSAVTYGTSGNQAVSVPENTYNGWYHLTMSCTNASGSTSKTASVWVGKRNFNEPLYRQAGGGADFQATPNKGQHNTIVHDFNNDGVMDSLKINSETGIGQLTFNHLGGQMPTLKTVKGLYSVDQLEGLSIASDDNGITAVSATIAQ